MDLAVCLIRDLPHYRKAAFVAGLAAAGYQVADAGDTRSIGRGDILVCWNLYGGVAGQAAAWRARGGTVLVCENGYYGRDAKGRQYYAIAAGGHNGSGRWPPPQHDRLSALSIDFKPWRTEGDHILICGQRGIGPVQTAQPLGWEQEIAKRLKKLTKRPLRIRPHPGNSAPGTPLSDDLKGCWAVVTWASNCATQALIAGIPVLYCGPHIATAGAAIRGVESIENPQPGDRVDAFRRLAWGQWNVDEIQSGEPFERLRFAPY